MLFTAETDEKSIIYKKMQSLVDTASMISITRDSWRHIQMLWQQMELLVGFSAVERTELYIVETFFKIKCYSSLDAALALVVRFSITGRIRRSRQMVGESGSSLTLGQ